LTKANEKGHKQKGFLFLSFIFPNRGFSMGYSRKKQKIPPGGLASIGMSKTHIPRRLAPSRASSSRRSSSRSAWASFFSRADGPVGFGQ
jgi:hypothetical protein